MKTITPAEMRKNFLHYNEMLHRKNEERNEQRERFLENQRRSHEHREAIKQQAASFPDGVVDLKCGHPALVSNGSITFMPSCFCDPVQIVETPNLSGRIARCSGCRHKPPSIAPSSADLPFFRYCEGKPSDEYDCFCWSRD